MKVLAVHWQKEVLEEIEHTLCPPRWYVRSMTSGLDALLSARAEQYDLIFCCLDLPMVTGIEFARSVRNLSANKNTPIIFLSDGEETEGQRELLSKLKTDWLTVEEIGSLKDLKI
ncbi:MAG: response regulator [Cyclobacteriaceae bacterium]|nr:response regulator [Cyclobacteriaceae bacterium]